MKKSSFVAPAALLLVLSACSNDIETAAPVQKEMVLTASMETPLASRANFTTSGDFFWTTGDKIKVYSTNGSFNAFKVISGAGTASATFSGALSGSTSTCAVYPAEAAKSVSGTTLTFEAPSSYCYDYEQSEFATTMVPNVNSTNVPMVAKIATTGSTNLNFKNLGGAFCFKFKDVPANTAKIVFTANSKICGSFTVDLSEATPTINTVATSNKKYKSIAVEFEPSDVKTDRIVYIPVPCGTYEGYEVEMYDEDGNTTAYLESSKTKVVERCTALRFNNVTVTTLSGGIEGEDTSSNTINGHEYVDLGLSVKWATCNIGADKSSDFGDYFAWGEIETKDVYNATSCTWNWKDEAELKANGVIDDNLNLTPEWDAATAKWGSAWHIPTKADFDELWQQCSLEWITQDGIAGVLFTGANDNTIFMPAAKYLWESSYGISKTQLLYWTATTDGFGQAYYFSAHFNYGYLSPSVVLFDFSGGLSIRPVTK